MPLVNPVTDGEPLRQHLALVPSVEVYYLEEYLLCTVRSSCINKQQLQYLVYWTSNYALMCKPAKYDNRLQIINEFHRCNPNKIGQLVIARGGPLIREDNTISVQALQDSL